MSPWFGVRARLDRVVAVLLGLAVSPMVVVLAALVRRHDGGPAFIRVARVGQGRVPFGMWKLRTMRAERPDGGAGGAALTTLADTRVTPIGRVLRRYHLDELPQLLNVVVGDMLLLGPRPEAPDYVGAPDRRWDAVLAVPPGIAGPTQVMVGAWEQQRLAGAEAGASDEVYRTEVLAVKLALDEWYVRSASPRIDVEVLLALALPFLPGHRRGPLHARVVRSVPETRAVDPTASDPAADEATADADRSVRAGVSAPRTR